MTNLEIIWLAIGIALTSATQLRLTSFPLGPGEFMVCAWMLFVGIKILILRNHQITHITRVMFWFWMVSLTSLTSGLLIAELMGLKSDAFFHNALALTLSFLFSMIFLSSGISKKDLEKLVAVLISFTIISLSIMILFPSILPFISPWYFGVRFRGWSNNPNQLGLLFSIIPFLTLYLLNISKNKLIKIWYVLMLILSLIIGQSTISDSLIMAWSISVFSLIILMIYQKTFKVLRQKINNRRFIAVYQGIAGLCALIIFLILTFIMYDKVSYVVADAYNYGSQGDDRITVWLNGIDAMFHSPLFGLGPGSFSGNEEPFLNVEAHNTFIDWGGNSGVLGLISYISLLVWVRWNAWRNKSFIMLAAFISLVGFTIFHYVLRQTIFWFFLITIV